MTCTIFGFLVILLDGEVVVVGKTSTVKFPMAISVKTQINQILCQLLILALFIT